MIINSTAKYYQLYNGYNFGDVLIYRWNINACIIYFTNEIERQRLNKDYSTFIAYSENVKKVERWGFVSQTPETSLYVSPMPRFKDKPDKIIYYPSGQIKKEEWNNVNNEWRYRKDGKPSRIEYYENGDVSYELYVNEEGQIIRESYYDENGVESVQ